MPHEDELYQVEVVDGEVVHASQSQVEPVAGERLPLRVAQPAVQTVVAAATGFVAGAAAMALLRRYAQSRLEPAAAPTALEPLRAGQARSYVVHVRQLG